MIEHITQIKRRKFGRGDACWLYKSANQTLAIAARIEQLLTVKQTSDVSTSEEEDKQKEAEAAKILEQVKQEYSKRKGRSDGSTSKQ